MCLMGKDRSWQAEQEARVPPSAHAKVQGSAVTMDEEKLILRLK